MENTNVNVNAPVIETVAAPAPVAPVNPIPATPKKEKPDALTIGVGVSAIAGVVETTGLLIYFGIKLGKKVKAKIKAKKAAEQAQQKEPVEAAPAEEPVKEEAPAAAE